MSTADRFKGKAQEVKGRMKEDVGRLTGNPRLEAEGSADRKVGGLKQAWRKVRDAFRAR